MPRTTTTALAAICLLTASCWPFAPGEGTITVSGTVNYEACILSVGALSGNDSPTQRAVSQAFIEEFSALPDKEGHALKITCDGKVIAAQYVSYGSDLSEDLEIEFGNL